ncbi:MAG: methionine synthase [Nitrospinae bacterium]|nr:methionine synthase [Nitrospinota bacterium]
MLLTTTVGSFPKPAYLLKARNQFGRGEISRGELFELEKRATREVIQLQEELGLDILVDGELYRGDMVAFFAEQMEGFAESGLVRSYGNRYYRKPIVVGPVKRPKPITVEWFQFAQSLTQKPVKGMLTGPYTIAEWSFDEYYPDRRPLVLDLAYLIHEEALDLEKAGAHCIQIDEPAIHTRPAEDLELAIEAMAIVTDRLKARTITHICYGDVPRIYPDMLRLAVDELDLAMKNTNYELLDLFQRIPFTKEIGFGVIDAHNHRIETVEEVIDGIKRALEVLRPEQIYVYPDCGLKTRTWEEARQKLAVMVEGTRRVRLELLGKA